MSNCFIQVFLFCFSKSQQHRMASYCTDIFGDMLLKFPLESHPVSNLPFCPQDFRLKWFSLLLYNSGDVSLKNLVLDKLMILQLIFLIILMYCLLDIVLVQWGEILSWYSQRVDYFKFVALFVIKEKTAVDTQIGRASCRERV